MQLGIGVSITSNPFRAIASLTIDSLTYLRGTAGVAPDLDSTVSSIGTVTGNYTLYWATRSAGTALSKTAIQNGSIDTMDRGTVVAATLDALDASLDLSNSLTNGAIDAFIRDSSATPIESAVASTTGVNYDAAAPVFASAEVGSIDASSLVVTFGKAIYGSTSAADWDVQVGGAAATESAAVIDGATVDITLGAAVTNGQTVTVAYNGTGIVGIDAEQSATFLAQSVTNNVSGAFTELHPDPNFQGLASYAGSDWIIGSGVADLFAPNASNQSITLLGSSSRITVTENTAYRLRVNVSNVGPPLTENRLELLMQWYNSGGGLISSSISPISTITTTGFVSFEATSPPLAVKFNHNIRNKDADSDLTLNSISFGAV